MMCEDVDECQENVDLCAPGQCVNVEAGFQCQCPRDYMLSPDGKVMLNSD